MWYDIRYTEVYTREGEVKMAHTFLHIMFNMYILLSTLHGCSFFLSPFQRRVHILNSKLAYTFITIECERMNERTENRVNINVPCQIFFKTRIASATSFFLLRQRAFICRGATRDTLSDSEIPRERRIFIGSIS